MIAQRKKPRATPRQPKMRRDVTMTLWIIVVICLAVGAWFSLLAR